MDKEKQHEIKDMRQFLFAQMERLSSPTCDLEKEVKRTEAMINVSKTLIDSAKVEVDYVRVTNKLATGFIGGPVDDEKKGQKILTNGVAVN
jgi:hypothetical protein